MNMPSPHPPKCARHPTTSFGQSGRGGECNSSLVCGLVVQFDIPSYHARAVKDSAYGTGGVIAHNSLMFKEWLCYCRREMVQVAEARFSGARQQWCVRVLILFIFVSLSHTFLDARIGDRDLTEKGQRVISPTRLGRVIPTGSASSTGAMDLPCRV